MKNGKKIFDGDKIYRKRAVKAPCFSCGDETAQKKLAKNKSFLYNSFGFIVHIGLGQRPMQETLLDLKFLSKGC